MPLLCRFIAIETYYTALIHVIHVNPHTVQLCIIFCLLSHLKLCYCKLLLMHDVTETFALLPVYYGHLEVIHKCPDYQGVLIIWVNLYV